MTSNGKNEQASYIYLGLAGETGRGRVVDFGPVPHGRRQ